MRRKPRGAAENLFDRAFSVRLAWQGAMIGLLTLAAYAIGELVVNPGNAYARANTMAFATLTFCQLFHAFDVRSEEHSIFQIGIYSNRAMNRAFWIGAVLQLAVLCLPPLQAVFHTVTLRLIEWLVVLGLALVPVVLTETVKAVSGLFAGSPRTPAGRDKPRA
jgi:Ca2+-transporting ATPase